MKTLAVRQPWATYIAEHTKTLEIRTWRTAYRGPLLIVASGRPHKHADEDGQLWTLPARVQVCVVDLLDVRPMTRADEALAHVAWAPGLYAWRLANPRHVRPVAHRGRLNLYSTPDETITLLDPDHHYLDHQEHAMSKHETKTAHYSVFGVSTQPAVADASGYIEFREGFEGLPETEWTAAERWISEREAEISAWRQQ